MPIRNRKKIVKRKTGVTKTPKSPIIYTKDGKTDIDETLFRDRQIFLYEEVCGGSCADLIVQIKILNKINSKPIYLHVSSPGGGVAWGFALIDAIKASKAPVITIASGMVASMGSLIFIAGKERHCHKSATFMFHDMFSGVVDYAAKMEARMEFQKKEWLLLVDFIRKHTKLSEKELADMRSGELWLFSDEAVKKGVADKII